MLEALKGDVQAKCTSKEVRDYFGLSIRIVGGEDTDIREHIWTVPILYEENGEIVFYQLN